jgi:hypothetical protein
MWIVQAISLLIATGLALVIWGKKVDAQPAEKGDALAQKGPGKKRKSADAGAPDAAAAVTDSSDKANKDEKKDDAAKGDGGADPIDYAVVQTDEDFPSGLSEEERTAIGTGKVPIHREGPYKSPLAHPRFGGATNVKVGLVIREIREFNIQTGGFEADFFLSLTGDKDLPNLNLAFTNGHEVNVTSIADSATFKLLSVTGKFTTAVDLREYPFDTQVLDIAIEDQKAGIDQLVFEPDKNRTSLDSSFRLSSFSAAGVGAVAYKHKYPPRFDRDDLYVSRYKFSLAVERFATSAAFSVYVPALIIVLISLTGMWVPPEELEVRSNAGAPMLAAAVLFHYSLIQSLPATGYLTHADKLMLGVYLSLLLNMLSTWGLLLGDEEHAARVFRAARTFVPVATVFIMIASIVI